MARTRCRAPGRTTPTRATSRTQSGKRFLTQGGLKMTSSDYLQTLTTAFIGCLAAVGPLGAGEPLTGNPYAPAYDHAYRHGAVPTREALQRMRAWEAAQRAAPILGLPGLNTLSYGGGIDGIGVTSGTPRVYLVFYGSQWTGGGGPPGAADYLQNRFRGIGTGVELWSATMPHDCDGPTVPAGATTCNPSNTPHVGYPSSGALAGVWFDTAAPSPPQAHAATPPPE